VSVSLQKIEGVEAVSVLLNKGLAHVTLKPGNKVTLAELRRVIERNAFTPQAASIVAEADAIAASNGQLQIRVTGTNETFPVVAATPASVMTELTKQAGKRLIVEAVVPASKENPAGAMELKTIKPSAR